MEKTTLPSDSHPFPALVVKIGGSVLSSQDTTLQDIVTLQQNGMIPVVIHGGGQVISEWMKRQGTVASFVNGLRVTDVTSMEIVAATLGGLVNKSLVATIQRLGGRALGMSGVDGGMLQAQILDPNLGYVGKIIRVDTTPIHQAIQGGYIPVIAPMAIHTTDSSDLSGSLLNVNGDTAAGEIARELESESIVFLTDVEGVMDADNQVIDKLTTTESFNMIRAGTVTGGMVPKIESCLRALEKVKVAHILDGRRSRALLEFVEGHTTGTRID